MIRASFLLLLSTVAAHSADVHFCWIGENGYTLDGEMSFPDALLTAPVITEADVTAFRIIGYHDEVPVGTWSLAQLTPTTTWHLRYDPSTGIFPTGGSHRGPSGQAWNANGAANDCGDPGFGFNSGTNAQDVCIDNTWITDSSINRFTEFRAFDGPLGGGCGQPYLLGLR